MSIKIVYGYECKDEVKKLFTEYTNMLIGSDDDVAECLQEQGYLDEFTDLECKYGMPDGRLYIAYYNRELAGCIALRKMDDDSCEMKRLYVRPKFRGKKIGNKLIEKIISDAYKIGYKRMFLDTANFLKPAIRLYRKYGFKEIEAYYYNPMKSAVYMKLEL